MDVWNIDLVIAVREAIGDRLAALVLLVLAVLGSGGVLWFLTAEEDDLWRAGAGAGVLAGFVVAAGAILLVGFAVLVWAWRTVFGG